MCETFGEKTDYLHGKLRNKHNDEELDQRLDWKLNELADVRLVFRITEEEFILSDTYKRMRRKPPPKEKTKKVKVCDWCGEVFEPVQKWRKLCSPSCRAKWETYWNEDPVKHELGWGIERLKT